jgi:hypothetical protein
MTHCPTCAANITVSIGYRPDSQVKRYSFDFYQPLTRFFCASGFDLLV